MANTTPFIARPLSYFDRTGECNFPSSDLIRANARQGVVTALVLDANICLNLSNYSRGQKDPDKESTFRQFLLAVELVNVDVVPYFGCLELASSRGSDLLDTDKLLSITSNVARALAQTEESLAMGGSAPTKIRDTLTLDDTSISEVRPLLRYAYCCFLKIFEIRSHGFLKDRAVKNFIAFFDWCESMNCQIALISQAALALFGGASDANKLLSPRKGKSPLDAAWGAAWDIWHCWMVQNYLPTLPVDGLSQHPIFVTDDAAAAYIAKLCVPRALILDSGQPFLSASAVDYDFPFYADKRERLNELLKERNSARSRRVLTSMLEGAKVDNSQIEEEIERLEKSILTSWNDAA